MQKQLQINPSVLFFALGCLLFVGGAGFYIAGTNQKQVHVEQDNELLELVTVSSASSTSAAKQSEKKEVLNSAPVMVEATKKEAPQVSKSTANVQDDNSDVEITSVRVIPSAFSATVKWNTNVPTTGRVIYWLSYAAASKNTVTTNMGESHEVELPTLDGTSYKFFVEATAASGKSGASEEREFKTLFDVIDPQVNSVTISRGVINGHMRIQTSEPVKVSVKYAYDGTADKYSSKISSTYSFSTDSVLSFDAANGWNGNSVLRYSIYLEDRAGNLVSTNEISERYVLIKQE